MLSRRFLLAAVGLALPGTVVAATNGTKTQKPHHSSKSGSTHANKSQSGKSHSSKTHASSKQHKPAHHSSSASAAPPHSASDT
jgi:hypothetical protein